MVSSMPVDVLTAARRRIARVLDAFERIVVSVSGGKDSLVLWHLVVEEVERRGRKVEVFFLDQEAEYAGTIAVIEAMMRDPAAIPRWYQVPLRMTNATSHRAPWLHAWEPGAEWMRPKSPIAIHSAPEGAPDRFYDFFSWYEKKASEPTAFFVGLRARESLNRNRAVRATQGRASEPSKTSSRWEDVGWSTAADGEGSYRFYPLFDWAVGDVWKYIVDQELPYNPVYDRMAALRGANERTMRVSFLAHEQSYRALATLQEIEPETHDALVRRMGGAHYAALYAEEPLLSAHELPQAFGTWREYRDHLLASTPSDKIERFRKRFARHGDDEATCREHVRQLLINDWENNVPVRRAKASKLRELWWDRL